MKTATVRDLRNRFASVAKWIEDGEPVTITRHGAAFATLSPATTKKSRKVNWAERLARVPPVGRKMTKKETEELWKAVRD